MEIKQIRTLERVFKGVSNIKRIRILELIKNNTSISLDEIAKSLKGNYQTTAEHVRRLKIAGLINDRYKGKSKSYELSPYGEKIIKIIKSFLV